MWRLKEKEKCEVYFKFVVISSVVGSRVTQWAPLEAPQQERVVTVPSEGRDVFLRQGSLSDSFQILFHMGKCLLIWVKSVSV